MSNLNLNSTVENTTTLKSVETLKSLTKHFGCPCFVDTEMDYDYIEGTCYAVCYKDQDYDGFVEFTNYVECNGEIILQSELHEADDILNSTPIRVYLDENDDTIHLFNSEKFEEVNVCECYDKYGQKIGCENAGCSSFANSYSRDLVENKVTEDDFDTYEEYEIALKKQFDEQIGTEHDTVEAYNYWDGSNWQTLHCNQTSKFGQEQYSGLSLMDNEKEMAIILKAYDNKEYTCQGFGYEEFIGKYAGKSYKFTTTQYTSDPFIAEVEEIED